MKMTQNGQVREIKAVVQAIRSHRRFVVSSHINPEGDALGSAIALASLLKRMGKQVTLANDGGIPKAFDFLPCMVPVLSRPRAGFKADVSVVVDVPTFSRVGSMQRLIRRVPTVICIDHHVSNQRFADINWVDPKAAATGELIYRLYQAFGVKPNQAEALCLYVSIVTDTGSFRYMNTTPAVHRIVAELIATGVSPLKVAQQLFESYSAADLKFLGTILCAIKQTPDGQIVWLEVPHQLLKDSKAGPEIVDELVNYPRSIRTAQVAFVLRPTEDGKRVRVSMRSKGTVDVDQIARTFGGGGHMAASGCTVEGTLSQARGKVVKVVRQVLKKKKH